MFFTCDVLESPKKGVYDEPESPSKEACQELKGKQDFTKCYPVTANRNSPIA